MLFWEKWWDFCIFLLKIWRFQFNLHYSYSCPQRHRKVPNKGLLRWLNVLWLRRLGRYSHSRGTESLQSFRSVLVTPTRLCNLLLVQFVTTIAWVWWGHISGTPPPYSMQRYIFSVKTGDVPFLFYCFLAIPIYLITIMPNIQSLALLAMLPIRLLKLSSTRIHAVPSPCSRSNRCDWERSPHV